MKRLLITVAAAGLVSFASAQTDAQASGSANGSTSVQAGQNNANVNSNTSTDANAQANHSHRKGNANASGNANNDSAASVNGKSVSAGANGAGDLAAGTTIPATLSKPVDARKAKPGDEISAKTTQEVRSASGVVIPRGSRLVGHVTDAKAKSKGDTESALGIAFDHVVLRNGQQVPLNASIKAIAAAANSASASMGDNNLGSATDSSLEGGAAAGASRSSGGLIGGATNAVGSTAGGVANGVGNTVGSVGANTTGTVSGATRGASGQLTSQSQGVIGLNGLQLSSGASNSTQGSVITSAGKDVKLDSGTQMLLQVNQQ